MSAPQAPTRWDSYQIAYRRGTEALPHEPVPEFYSDSQRRAYSHGRQDAAGSAKFQTLYAECSDG